MQMIINLLGNVVVVDDIIITGAVQGTSLGSGDSAVEKTDMIFFPESHS